MLTAILLIVWIVTFALGMLAMGFNSMKYCNIENKKRHSFWPGLDIDHIDNQMIKKIKSSSKWTRTPHSPRRRWNDGF